MTAGEVEKVIEQVAELKVADEPEKGAGDENIVDGPTLELPKKCNEKKLAKIVKAGGKRGVEIEGAADMGGLQYFCTKMDEPAANLALLVEATKAMNAKSDPSEEERKGGAGKVGKIVMSATETECAIIAYVPKDKTGDCSAKDWLKQVMVDCLDGSEKKFEACELEVKSYEGVDEKSWATCEVKNNPEKELFVMKFKDQIISHAYAYLRKRGLFPEDDEDSEEMVFGDEDFGDL